MTKKLIILKHVLFSKLIGKIGIFYLQTNVKLFSQRKCLKMISINPQSLVIVSHSDEGDTLIKTQFNMGQCYAWLFLSDVMA